jgi:hypothetical protein
MLAKKDLRRASNESGPVSPSREDLANGFWSVSELGELPPGLRDQDTGFPTVPQYALRLSDDTLSNVAFLARAVGFRIKGDKPLERAGVLELPNKPAALHGPLSQVMDYCISNTTARDAVAAYLVKVFDEKLDRYGSMSALNTSYSDEVMMLCLRQSKTL